jgi:uncharacterized protein (DUF362 family)
MAAPPASPDRREFVRRVCAAGGSAVAAVAGGLWLSSRSQRPTDSDALIVDRQSDVLADPSRPELVVAVGGSPEALAGATIEALGGIRRFVSRGDIVLVKPNVGWDRTEEQAANTNPALVAAVVRLCQEAGARRVVVTDVSCNDPKTCFERSGIATAVRATGADLVLPEPRRFVSVDLRGDSLGVWPVLRPCLEVDKVINVPVAKHHSLTGVTLGMKNWYGILGGQRNRLHQRINESLSDLAAFMRPALTLTDAWRVLVRNGPTGGSLADVEVHRTLVGSTDPVAVDAWVAQAFWRLDARRLAFLRLAASRGLGRMNLDEVRTMQITVAG